MREPASKADSAGNKLEPLPGEPGIPSVAQPARISVSKKGLLAVALLVLSLVVVCAISIQRLMASGKKPEDAVSKRAGDRPAAATTEPRRFDLSVPAVDKAASATRPAGRVPAIVPSDDELAEPIGVRRTGPSAPPAGGPKPIAPEDAPAVLVSSRPTGTAGPIAAGRGASPTPTGSAGVDAATSTDPLDETRRNLEAYERQLQGLLDGLTAKSNAASAPFAAVASPGGNALGGPSTARESPPAGGARPGALFGGQLQGSATPRVEARMLGNRSLILPKGTTFTCALETKVISAASGLVSCLVQRNVFGSDGRILLVERGSKVEGEYRIASVKPGTVRIPVLWTRIRTPNGVTVDIDSPATGPLGESGIDGYVDNRWGERIGAALLLSLIDDSVQLALQHESSNAQGNSIVLPSTTTTTSKLAEKVLDSTINIPPLIYQNQGGIVGVYVARDVDFSSVYELQPSSEGVRP